MSEKINNNKEDLKDWINKNWNIVEKSVCSKLMKEFNNDLSPDSSEYVRLLTISISDEVKDKIIKILNAYEVKE